MTLDEKSEEVLSQVLNKHRLETETVRGDSDGSS
jgi:hypothetical protein